MLLKRAEDYRFVKPDADAMEGGAHPFSGEIYPRRSDARKNILSYEDICFLQEACGELFAALMYFNNTAPSYFPFGTTYHRPDGDPVPRALLGSAVGRFSDSYGSATSVPYYLREFMNHYPGNDGQYIDKFIAAVGKDVKKLFTNYMACSPQTGRTLEDLKGYISDAGKGYVIPTTGIGFFDVFYTLVTMASSLGPFKATADPHFDPEGVPASFGSAYVGSIIKHYGTSTWGRAYWAVYDEIAYHDGFQFFTWGTPTVGRIDTVFVKPSFPLPTSSEAVMETSAEPNGSYPPNIGVVTFKVKGAEFTSADLQAEDYYAPEVLDHDPKSLQLAYGALEASLGMKLSEMSMGVVKLSPEVDISNVSMSMIPTQEMLAPLWVIPSLCKRIFIARMRPSYISSRLKRQNFLSLDAFRATDRYDGSVTYDVGPGEAEPRDVYSFPGYNFYKSINGYVAISVTGEHDTVTHVSSETWVRREGLASGPEDPSVEFGYGNESGRATTMFRALNGILKKVDATVLATVYHYDAAWVELNGAYQLVRFECKTKTFPIRYSLESPKLSEDENKHDTIAWTPSKTELEMVDEILGHMGMDRESVFPDSYVTQPEPLPDPSTDERMPSITVASGSGSASFKEIVSISFSLYEGELGGDGFWFASQKVHYGFAEISPRTADQS